MKVAIVGGGICGLYLGWKLSEKGHKVTIFEKKKKIKNEVCSGLFSQRILKFLPQSRELIQNQINFALLHFPKKTIKIKFSKKFFVMSHSELDKLTGSLAKKAGVKIILNYNVRSLPKGFDKIIGCDGANSFVRERIGLPAPLFRLGIQGFTQHHFPRKNSKQPKYRESGAGFIKKKCSFNYVEVWPCEKGFTQHHFPRKNSKQSQYRESGAGFIWKIPRGKEIEYGILASSRLAQKLFKDFSKRNNLSLKKVKSKIVPQGFIIPSNSSITLCGDAAGLTKPWSGGGVIWGLSAAEILLKSFPNFLNYQKKAKKFFVPKIILSKIAIKTVYFLGFKVPYLLPKKVKMESDFLL